MGLFNNGKNDKVEKVEKYEEQQDASPSKPHHHSSKPHPKKFSGAIIRPMPQPSLIPNNQNYFTPTFGYPQFKYGFSSNTPYDLTKYVSSPATFNPFMYAQPTPTNFAPIWSNGMSAFNDRSPFQQQQQQQQPAFNMYQQNGWPSFPPSTNGYMPPMNF
jgi:hypothetical protein